MQQVIFVNSDNLTADQKLYEPKTVPKHYKPLVGEDRLENFNKLKIARDPREEFKIKNR